VGGHTNGVGRLVPLFEKRARVRSYLRTLFIEGARGVFRGCTAPREVKASVPTLVAWL